MSLFFLLSFFSLSFLARAFSCRSAEMRLFLTVIPHSSLRAAQDSSSPDTITIFDDGVWTRSEPSSDAFTQVSATFVAQEVQRQAALTEVLRRSKEDVVCFRCGPRPPPQLDFMLFHKQDLLSLGLQTKTSSVRQQTSAESAGVSSTLATPTISLSSTHSERSLPSSSSAKSEQRDKLSFTSASMYDSFLSRWLLEVVTVQKLQATLSGCLFFVDGTAADLNTQQNVRAPLSTRTGTTRVLRTADDVHTYLTHCERAVLELTKRRTSPTPYHMWVTVRVGASPCVTAAAPAADDVSAVTFLDLACPADYTGMLRGGARTRLREQLRLFGRQLSTASSEATQLPGLPNANSPTAPTADRRWLGFLQSCQLSRVEMIGVFCLAQKTGRNPFDVSPKENGCDLLALSAELRQRALVDAVNNGALHPQHPSTRDRLRRLKLQRKEKKTKSTQLITPTSPKRRSISTEAVSRSVPQIEPVIESMPQLPSLKHVPSPVLLRNVKSAQSPGSRSPTKSNNSRNNVANTARLTDLFASLDAEEDMARGTLIESEARARDLVWMRWVLRAHPPNTSVIDVARQLSSAVSRLQRQKVRSAPLRQPPPLIQADLAATARAPSSSRHSNHSSNKTPSSSTASKLHVAVPALTPHSCGMVHMALPLITPTASPSHVVSSVTSPSYRHSAATSVMTRHALRSEVLDDAGGRPHRDGIASAAESPQVSPTLSATGRRRRRYSALEVALLKRAHSATQRSSPAASQQNGGEVELLYPLVRSFHAEVTAQDAVMAAELMARSTIELRELNRRRTLESLAAEQQATATATSPTNVRMPNGRQYSASPKASRVFFYA